MAGAGLTGAVTDIPARFTITARDGLGNRVLTGGAPFRFVVLPGSAALRVTTRLVDNRDGTYSATYTVTSGTGLVTLYVTLEGVQVTAGCPTVATSQGRTGCRATVRATAGPFVLEQTRSSGPGAFVGFANEPIAGFPLEANPTEYASGRFDIELLDAAGIPLATATEPFAVLLNNSAEGVVLVPGGPDAIARRRELLQQAGVASGLDRPVAPGTYAVFYARSRAGAYSLKITHAGADVTELVLGSHPDYEAGRLLTLYPAGTAPARSSYQLLSPLPAAVGEPIVLGLAARDRFGNLQRYSPENPDPGAPFVATLEAAGAVAATATVTEAADAALARGVAGLTQAATFAPLRLTGSYAVRVRVGAESVPPLAGSAPPTGLVLGVVPGAVDAMLAAAEGDGLRGAMAGESATVEVTPRDAGGNVVNDGSLVCDVAMARADGVLQYTDTLGARVFVEDAVDAFCTPDPSCLDAASELECVYLVTYNVTHAAVYNLTVRLCTEEAASVGDCAAVGGGPFPNVTVSPGPVPDAAAGYIVFVNPPTRLAAGEEHTLMLQAQDGYGNDADTGGLALAVYFQLLPDGGVPGTPARAINDNNDGSYEVLYELEEGGLGVRYLCTVYLGTDVAANLTLQTSAPPISAERSFVYGAATERAVAGVLQTAFVQLADHTGRYQSDVAWGQQIRVTLSPQVVEYAPTIVRQNDGDRLMLIQYLAFEVLPDGYTLTVELESDSPTLYPIAVVQGVGAGPNPGVFRVQLLPGPIMPNMTYIDDALDYTGVAGVMQVVRIVTRDAYGNRGAYKPTAARLPLLFEPDGDGPDGEPFLQGPGPALAAYVELAGPGDPGVYVARWMAEAAGSYGLRIYLGGAPLRAGPSGLPGTLAFFLAAGPSDYTAFTALGPGVTAPVPA
eukprot:9259432-Pyramimonas_sp.AAC.1